MNCKSCVHWERRDPNDYLGDPEIDRADWDNPPASWLAFGHCQRARGSDGEAVDAESLAYARDCDSYAATLVTHESFGCVQWKAKE